MLLCFLLFLLLQLIPASEIMEELPTKHCSMCLSSFFFVSTWLSHSQTAPFTSFLPLEKHYKVFFMKGQRGAPSHLHHLLPIMQNQEALAAVRSKKIYILNWDSYCGSVTVSLHYNLVFMFLLIWQVFKLMDTSFKWRKYCLKVTRRSCIGYIYVALKWYNFKVKKCQ